MSIRTSPPIAQPGYLAGLKVDGGLNAGEVDVRASYDFCAALCDRSAKKCALELSMVKKKLGFFLPDVPLCTWSIARHVRARNHYFL